jgi:hypothetical protein
MARNGQPPHAKPDELVGPRDRFDNEEHGGEFHQGPGIETLAQEAEYTDATVLLPLAAPSPRKKG